MKIDGGCGWLLLAALVTACAGDDVATRATPVSAAPSRPSWPSLYALVPADAQSLLFVDYRQLSDGALARAWLAAGGSADERRRQQGFAEAEDVAQSVQVSLPPGAGAGAASSLGDNLALYNLDPRVSARALLGSQRAGAGDLPSFRGRSLHGQPAAALARLRDHQVALGTQAGLRAVIDCADGIARNLTEEPWFDEAGRAFRAVWPDGGRPALELWVNVTQQVRAGLLEAWPELGPLRWFTLRVSNHEGLRVGALARAGDADGARAVGAFLAERVSQLAESPGLVGLGLDRPLQGLLIRQRGRDVELGLTLDAAAWEDLRARVGAIGEYVARQRRDQAGQSPP